MKKSSELNNASTDKLQEQIDEIQEKLDAQQLELDEAKNKLILFYACSSL